MSDFFVMGLETEYGLVGNVKVKDLISQITKEIRSVGGFLENGGRLYLDRGDHLEFSTPECPDPYEVALYHHGFDTIIWQAIQKLRTRRAQCRTRADLAGPNQSVEQLTNCYRNNLADCSSYEYKPVTFVNGQSKATFGCHENYLVDRLGFGPLTTALLNFLATRPITVGSGAVIGSDYFLSPRALVTKGAKSSSTIGPRGLINTRDSPLLPTVDHQIYRRLHLICGDSNVSPSSTFLKVGSTALVLRAIERAGPVRNVDGVSPLNHLLLFSQPFGWAETGLGSVWQEAVDVQQRYLDHLVKYWSKCDLPGWAIDVSNHWQFVLDKLRSGELDKLVGRVDWVTKRWLINIFRAEYPTLATINRLESLDLAYHSLYPGDSIFPNFLPLNYFGEELVRESWRQPSTLSRPMARSAVIRTGTTMAVDWVGYRPLSGPMKGERVDFNFP